MTYDGYGFHSGPKKLEGSYLQSFFGIGTVYYSSDLVEEEETLRLSGSVEVTLPEEENLELSILFSDVLVAKHVPSESVTYTPDNCLEANTSSPVLDASDTFMFEVLSSLTPTVDEVIIDQASHINVSRNRGHFQGQSTPTFTINGENFGADSNCENVIMIGSTECSVSSFTDTSISCSVASPLPSETVHDIRLLRLNQGYAAISSVQEDSYHVVSLVSDISPLEGSKGGGNLLTITGSGFLAADESATVIFVAQDQIPHDCVITAIEDAEIVCKIPTAYANSISTEINATVFVRIGHLQYPPAQEDGMEDTMMYTFKASLSPSVGSISNSSITLDSGAGTVEISGTGFGNDASNVVISLIPIEPGQKKRSIPLHEHHQIIRIEHRPLNKLHMSSFFHAHLTRGKRNDIKWRVGGSSSQMRTEMRNFDKREAKLNPMHSGVSLIFEDDYEGDNDLNIMEEESYWSFVNRHKRSTLEKSIERHWRSIYSHAIFRTIETEDVESYDGTVTSVTDTEVQASFDDIPAGFYHLQVSLLDVGNALNDNSVSTIKSAGSVDSISPSEGSILGGQEVTITGAGFHRVENTMVQIGDTPCEVTSVDLTTIVCITGSKGAEVLSSLVEVTSGDFVFPTTAYNYSTSSTPMVSSISAVAGIPGDIVTLNGTLMENESNKFEVKFGGLGAKVSSATSSSIQVEIPQLPGGANYSFEILTMTYGFAQISNNNFGVNLEILSISPVEGSKGGGTLLTITGTGFDTSGNVSIQVCGNECILQGSVLTDTIQCLTPSDETASDETSCFVELSQANDASSISSSNYTYLASLTPQINSITPNSGGSGGGTEITIIGTGFEASGNTIKIDGSVCVIKSENETEIICETNSHEGSGTYPVEVDVPGKGFAALPSGGGGTFRYVDRWSSIWTWGGVGIPQEGEFIVIERGQEIVLDVSTPKLAFLLLNGGHLKFEREEDGLVLNSEFILLLNDGVLEIGTEDEPYLNTATIMMHGHVRCIELPIYGCKVLGVRKGSLELHGKPVNNTWTHLAATANAEDTVITVVDDISDWEIGDEIVIPSTNDRHSLAENEKGVIAGIGADGKTITLRDPLKYKHISISQTFGNTTVETRAEVGRISRNVKYQGSVNEEFLERIPACEKKFNSNQFATQSCFNGKFGEELGSDEFGAVTLYAVKNRDMFEAKIHISYTEFFWVGQAFRVGRYPIHFHLMGNVTGSYSRGNAIHNSFNRAMTIHGITGVLAEQVVTYDIKGLSFFIEDGIEEDNIIRRNLAVYTRQSSSLLNPDVTPAAFWVVNPNNHLYENAAAGGTHFGFWYRIQRHPDGPSETTSYCSNNVPLGTFRDNSAHTFGWYGLWIFSMDGYFPKDGTRESGYCNGQNTVPAVYERLTAWRCERGAEVVFSGPVQFKDFIMLDNEKAGMEFVEVDGGYGEDGPGSFGGIVVGHSEISADDPNPNYCTHEGFIGPKLWTSTVNGTEFYNFDRPSCYALGTCSQCTVLTAPFAVLVADVTFDNSPNKVTWKWEHGGSFIDLDGTLTGTPHQTVIPTSPLYPPACTSGMTEFSGGNVDGSVCDDTVEFSRIAWNKPKPSSLLYAAVNATTTYGNQSLLWRKKDITHKAGWNGLFPRGLVVNLEWEDFTEMTNISYELSAWSLDEPDDYVLIQHNFNQEPDKVGVVPGDPGVFVNESLTSLPVGSDGNGQFYFDNDTLQLTYILSHNLEATSTRKKRGLGLTSFPISDPRVNERRSSLDIYRCLFVDCLPPPPPSFPTGRPSVILKWSEQATWTELEISKPVEGDDFELPGLYYLIVDEPLPTLGAITIYDFATLELQDTMDHVINCTHIFIHGGQLVAGELLGGVVPTFQHSITINLLGNTSTYDYPLPNGPVMGAKAIGVFGRMILNSQETTNAWSKIGETAGQGTKTIVLSEPVDWQVGATIMITSSSFVADEAERLTIASVSADGLTLTTVENLVHDHTENTYNIDGEVITLAAEVGLISRRIKIVGAAFEGNYCLLMLLIKCPDFISSYTLKLT